MSSRKESEDKEMGKGITRTFTRVGLAIGTGGLSEVAEGVLDTATKPGSLPNVPNADPTALSNQIAGELDQDVDQRRARLAAIRAGTNQNAFSFLVNQGTAAKRTLLGG